jgi:3-hydroxybutyryl-CoA dehydrogenase
MSVEARTVAIICVDALGRDLAYASAVHGFQTVVKDASEARLTRAFREFEHDLDYQLGQGKIAAEVHRTAMANLTVAPSVEDAIRRADLIIDTVHDEAEVKLELFTLFDKFALPDAILISSCSASISITELAAVTFCPDRCIGLTVQQCVPQTELFELVKGSSTSDQTVARCVAFLREIGKDCIIRSEPPPVLEEKLRASDKAESNSATIESGPPWVN